MKILIADDSKTLRMKLMQSLAQLGHQGIIASNGQETITLFQTERPDLIMLDVVMDEIDGFECAKRIRELSGDDWVPIIYLTGAVDDENLARGMNAGGDDYLTKSYSETTLAAKIMAVQRIADMRHKILDLTKKLSGLSATDALTGIYNRLQFETSLKEKIAHVIRYKKKLALLFIDLDNFKEVNDGFGHFIGDLLLQETAKRLHSCLRLDDFVARIGGDEFAVILSDVDNHYYAGEVAKKILTALTPPYHLAGNVIRLSSSIGIACYPSAMTEKENLVKDADFAMYHAKKLGRNNYQFYTEELKKINEEHISIKEALKIAIEKQEISLVFNPIYHLQTKKITRIEILPYLIHHEIGTISPDMFIAFAGKHGVLNSVGKWLFRTVCEQSVKWKLPTYKNIKLAINVSPSQLLEKNLLPLIVDILKNTHTPPEMLELELTENTPIIYSKPYEDILNKIHDLGINISLDNFGTGYSSLNHLKSLPIHTVKIDAVFLQDIGSQISNAMIIRSIITLGSNLGFDVIAKGIDNKKQLEFLIENGCLEGQGNFLSKSLTIDEIMKLLDKQQTKSEKVIF